MDVRCLCIGLLERFELVCPGSKWPIESQGRQQCCAISIAATCSFSKIVRIYRSNVLLQAGQQLLSCPCRTMQCCSRTVWENACTRYCGCCCLTKTNSHHTPVANIVFLTVASYPALKALAALSVWKSQSTRRSNSGLRNGTFCKTLVPSSPSSSTVLTI